MFSRIKIGDTDAWKCDGDVKEKFQQKLDRLLENEKSGQTKRAQNGFPGTMPISLERIHLSLFRKHSFHVTEKSDGTRFALWFTHLDSNRVCVAFDRRFDFCLLTVNCPSSLFRDTILDGEFVFDQISQTHVFLIFDCLVFEGRDIRDFPFSERITIYSNLVEKKSIRARNFQLEAKRHFDRVSDVNMKHKRWNADGLIFTFDTPIFMDNLVIEALKWKFTHTVDFLIQKVDRAANLENMTGYVFKAGEMIQVKEPVRIPADSLREYDERRDDEPLIVECRYNETMHCWDALKVRSDKSKPNSFFIYMKTLNSVLEHIDFDDLALIETPDRFTGLVKKRT